MADAGSMAVRPRSLIRGLLGVDGLLLGLHGVAVWLYLDGQRVLDRAFDGHTLFNADLEQSVPTWWQQLQLAGAACLALVLVAGAASSLIRRFWWCAAGLLVLMSVDEATETHERLVEPLRESLNISGGVLWFAWVIPASAVVLVVAALGITYGRRVVPSPARRPLVLGGMMFVLGAVGVEMLTGAYLDDGSHHYAYFALVALEEGLEMAGASVVVYGLLKAIGLSFPAPIPVVIDLDDHGDL
jgi:hypothetical protein